MAIWHKAGEWSRAAFLNKLIYRGLRTSGGLLFFATLLVQHRSLIGAPNQPTNHLLLRLSHHLLKFLHDRAPVDKHLELIYSEPFIFRDLIHRSPVNDSERL